MSTAAGTGRRLVGVGVGPGDPELVTVKALRVLRAADAVLVPVADTGETGRAEAIVRHHLPDDAPVRRMVFALGDGERSGRRADLWQRAAETVREAYDAGANLLAFATIGDPNVYSTFSYLARAVAALVSDVAVETVPGITALQDLAARSGTVLVEGDEQLLLVPVSGLDDVALTEALDFDGTVVAYKCGSQLSAVLDALDDIDRLDHAVYGAALGLPGEDIRKADRLDRSAAAPYLSTIIAPSVRSRRGSGP
jgi:precorrin-2/cobalt-factor-2 C20-methyltransferase